MTCALHCLLTPVLVASVSLGALGWLAGEGTELTLLSLATILAAVVLGWGWHAHRRLGSLGLFVVALMLIGAGRFFAPASAETPMVVAGGLSIALAHVVNAAALPALHRLSGDGRSAPSARVILGRDAIRRAGPATQPRPSP